MKKLNFVKIATYLGTLIFYVGTIVNSFVNESIPRAIMFTGLATLALAFALHLVGNMFSVKKKI